MPRSQRFCVARGGAGWCRCARSMASSGAGSEATMLLSPAASICEMRVEPQRDMWKMTPATGTEELVSIQPAISSALLSRRKSWWNGCIIWRCMVCS